MELDLNAYWMPFTPNRHFKSAPRIVVSAKDMFFTGDDGREILDGMSGLWCVSAGHRRQPIVDAVKAQLDRLDYAPAFQIGHPSAFMAAERIAALAPAGLDHVFFTCSGSEAFDSALRIALGYWRARRQGNRTVLIGRERAYHGVGFGGISVGGIPANRKAFGSLLPRVDHLRSTYVADQHAFARGEPEWGAHLADELEERIIPLHDPSNIAAVIVEPVMGSAGVFVPPKGYLQRLRAICDRHGILLIFDEVITGFGRLGKTFAADYFGVVPDMITFAKSVTNAVVPLGGVLVANAIHDTMMQGPAHAIELMHGYTYSGHPLATAAALATLDLHRDEELVARAARLAPYIENAVHGLRDVPNVVSIRNLGVIGAVELAPRPDAPGQRGYDVFVECFNQGVLARATGDILVFAPAFIAEHRHIDRMVDTLRAAITKVG